MFGEEFGSPLGNTTCKRCGSSAKLRGLQRSGTHIIVIHATCPKCHNVKFTGLTSVQNMAHQAVRNRLENMRNSTANPELARRIDHHLEMLERKKSLDDLGL